MEGVEVGLCVWYGCTLRLIHALYLRRAIDIACSGDGSFNTVPIASLYAFNVSERFVLTPHICTYYASGVGELASQAEFGDR